MADLPRSSDILALLPIRSAAVDTGDDALLIAVANSTQLRKLIISDLIALLGAGAITPGPFLEPTTATPEAIVGWLIDNGFMEAS